jgi:thermostable 8-oxoguanine DNA glycosylase
MTISVAERRQIENEMIFRRINEQVGADLDTLDAMHIEDGNPHLVRDDDVELHFQCECSDENCTARIPISLSRYRQIHLNRDMFIVKLKHQVQEIEDVVSSEARYCIVKKKHSTPEPKGQLNKTTINNKGL